MSWPKIPVVSDPWDGWMTEERPSTRCKHGIGACEKCGTTDRRDVVHTARTPDKRTARRLRRKGKR